MTTISRTSLTCSNATLVLVGFQFIVTSSISIFCPSQLASGVAPQDLDKAFPSLSGGPTIPRLARARPKQNTEFYGVPPHCLAACNHHPTACTVREKEGPSPAPMSMYSAQRARGLRVARSNYLTSSTLTWP